MSESKFSSVHQGLRVFVKLSLTLFAVYACIVPISLLILLGKCFQHRRIVKAECKADNKMSIDCSWSSMLLSGFVFCYDPF